jgi:hypothetical protein
VKPAKSSSTLTTSPPGRDFVEAMTTALKSSDVVLVVIGRQWLVSDGARRLDAPTDPVRVELRTAIDTKTPLIAVLVDRGVLPSASELPTDIRGVTLAKTVQLRDEAFDDSVGRLISTIAGLDKRPGRVPAPAVLQLINEAPGFFTADSKYNVHVDGKKVGVLISGKPPTELTLPPGEHLVMLQRGVFRSEQVAVTLKPGKAMQLGYDIGFLGNISLRKVISS